MRRLSSLARSTEQTDPESLVHQTGHDVTTSGGSPMPPSTRDFIEPRFGHDFSRVRVHSDGKAAESAAQIKGEAYTVGRGIARSVATTTENSGLTVSSPADPAEREAEQVAEELLRTPSVPAAMGVQRKCTACKDEEIVHRDATAMSSSVAPPEVSQAISRPGRPLPAAVRSYFEPRLGVDLSRVRTHDDAQASASAEAVQARAYTVGGDIVFRAGEFAPETPTGRRLLAHELVHTVQQGAAPPAQHQPAQDAGERGTPNLFSVGTAARSLQRMPLPGDGMAPPGDCDWPTYLSLKASVEVAKAIVRMLGGCSQGNTCLQLATRIAAFGTELTEREFLMVMCFKGGDSEHRGEANERFRNIQECLKLFNASNCSPDLLEAMKFVVDSVNEMITATVTVAMVVGLVVAIIALVELIAAAAAAAAEVAAIGAAIQALRVLLNSLLSSAG